MIFPTWESLGQVAWENYLVAQLAAAAMGLIERNTLALGLETDPKHVVLLFQVKDARAGHEDRETILDQYQELVGYDVTVSVEIEEREARLMPRPRSGRRWLYAAYIRSE